ncbi:nuclear transport factor 2 family protein [Bacillus sp. OK048]|uniref:nuclear transport factor 2 family protein n=1 Tax=Bacillus sp. OK048 TaxID=1882761 RepID=UPI00088913EC|nr:nuclear transport factor 2 family protein [Bacillus sp. OK048]SDL97967.1 SnoaL-like domain-containing protein [Bacillus sp. OK048]
MSIEERLQSLEKRLGYLEDIEAIEQLKYEYCAACDDQHNADRIVAIFTEDGIWDGGPFGVAKGHREIWDLFHNTHSPSILFSQHNVGNPIIKVNGNEAQGNWKFLAPMTTQPDNKLWVCAEYDEDYVKVDGVWKFKHLSAKVFFTAPYTLGW